MHCDATDGEFEPAGHQRRANSFLAFSNHRLGQSDQGKCGQPGAQVNFHANLGGREPQRRPAQDRTQVLLGPGRFGGPCGLPGTHLLVIGHRRGPVARLCETYCGASLASISFRRASMAASLAWVRSKMAACTSNSCRLTKSNLLSWACSTALKLPSRSRPKARTDSGTESASRRANSSNTLELIKLIGSSQTARCTPLTQHLASVAPCRCISMPTVAQPIDSGTRGAWHGSCIDQDQ